MIGGLGGIGKNIILFGAVLILAGLFLLLINKAPFIGKLPGDLYINRKNFTFYFPLTSSLLISLVLSFIIWLWSKR